MELQSMAEGEFNGSSGVGVTKFIPMIKTGADGKKSNATGWLTQNRGAGLDVPIPASQTTAIAQFTANIVAENLPDATPVTPVPLTPIIPATTAGTILGMSYLTAGIVGVVVLGLGVAGIIFVPKFLKAHKKD